MCLYTKNPKPLVAEEDIICYKVLLNTSFGYYTPFQLAGVEIPGHLSAIDCNIDLWYDKEKELFQVDGEGVHALKEFIEAERYEDELGNFDTVITECRIPAGTVYWLGERGDIAAQQMIINKILK